MINIPADKCTGRPEYHRKTAVHYRYRLDRSLLTDGYSSDGGPVHVAPLSCGS